MKLCAFIIKHSEVEGQSLRVHTQLNNTPAQTLCHLALKRLPYWIITCYQAAEREVHFGGKGQGVSTILFSPQENNLRDLTHLICSCSKKKKFDRDFLDTQNKERNMCICNLNTSIIQSRFRFSNSLKLLSVMLHLIKQECFHHCCGPLLSYTGAHDDIFEHLFESFINPRFFICFKCDLYTAILCYWWEFI